MPRETLFSNSTYLLARHRASLIGSFPVLTAEWPQKLKQRLLFACCAKHPGAFWTIFGRRRCMLFLPAFCDSDVSNHQPSPIPLLKAHRPELDRKLSVRCSSVCCESHRSQVTGSRRQSFETPAAQNRKNGPQGRDSVHQ